MPSILSSLKRNVTRHQPNSASSASNIQPSRNNSASRAGRSSLRAEASQPIDSMEIGESSSQSRGVNGTNLSNQPSEFKTIPTSGDLKKMRSWRYLKKSAEYTAVESALDKYHVRRLNSGNLQRPLRDLIDACTAYINKGGSIKNVVMNLRTKAESDLALLNAQNEQNTVPANSLSESNSVPLQTSPPTELANRPDSRNDEARSGEIIEEITETADPSRSSIDERGFNTSVQSLPASSSSSKSLSPESPSSSSSNSANENPAFAMPGEEDHWLPGTDGNQYSLVGSERTLRRRNSISDETTKTRLRNVDQIKLGANKTLYALSKNEIIQLNKECSEPVRLNTKQKVRDFAFTSNGLLFVLNKKGELFYHESNEIFKKQVSSGYRSLEMPKGVALSIAISAKGEIWLLSEEGDVRKGQISKAEGNAYKVKWGEAVSSEESFIKLETLPNGKIAGRNTNGELLYHDSSSDPPSWKPVSSDSIGFSDLHSNMHPSGTTELTTFFGSVASTEPIKKSGKSRFNANPFKSLKKNWQRLAHFGYETKRKKDPDRPTSMDLYGKRLAEYEEKLAKTLSPNGSISSNASIDAQTRELINGLLRQIGEKTKSYLDTLKNSPPPKLNKTRKAIIERSENILKSMKLVHQRAKSLTDLDTGLDTNILDDAIKNNLLFNPKLSAKAAELVVDHAILAEIIEKLNSSNNSAESISQIWQDAQKMWDESLPHLVCRSRLYETDPFGHAAQTFDCMQNIFLEKNDLLSSAVKHALPKNARPAETKSISQLNELFFDLVHSMKPGESIGLEKSKDVGFNTETFRFVVSGAVAVLNSNPLVAWIIPVVDVGKLAKADLVISKTDKGISIKVSGLSGKYGQLGARGGAGVVSPHQAGKAGTGWAFWGYELALKAKKTVKNEHSIIFNIDDHGTGEVGNALNCIFSGKANLFELLKQSASIELTKKKEKETKFTVSQVLVGAAGFTGPGYANMHGNPNMTQPPTGKPLGALVPELVVSASSNSVEAETKRSDGGCTIETTKRPFGLDAVAANVIGVAVLESDTVNNPDAVSNNMGALNRWGFPGVLPGMIIGKSWNNMGPKTKSVAIDYSEDGRPEKLSVNLVIQSNNIVSEFDKNVKEIVSEYEKNANKLGSKFDESANKEKSMVERIFSQAPGLKKVLEQLKKQPNPVNVSMELNPELLKALPEENKVREARMKELAKDLKNFRIKEINVSETRRLPKTLGVPIPLVTRSAGGAFNRNSKPGEVKFFYDKESIIKHAQSLLMSLCDCDNYDTQAKRERLKNTINQIDNLVESLSQNGNWFHGKSIEEDYKKKVNTKRSVFAEKVKKLTQEATDESLNSAIEALSELSKEIDNLNKGEFKPYEISEGPAILTSGELFSPIVDKSDKSTKKIHKAHNKDDANGALLNEVYRAINQLRVRTLSSKTWRFDLKKSKQKAFNDIDEVERILSEMTAINNDLKEAIIAELHVLVGGSLLEKTKPKKTNQKALQGVESSPNNEKWDNVTRLLDRLAWYPNPRPLESLPGVNADLIATLKKAGIENTEQLYCLSRSDFSVFDNETKLKLNDVRELVELSGLLRMHRVTPDFAKLLMSTNYKSVDSIAEAKPHILYQAVIDAINKNSNASFETKTIPKRFTEEYVQQLVADAKRINLTNIPEDLKGTVNWHRQKRLSDSLKVGPEFAKLLISADFKSVNAIAEADSDGLTKKIWGDPPPENTSEREEYEANSRYANEVVATAQEVVLSDSLGIPLDFAKQLKSLEFGSVNAIAEVDPRDLHQELDGAIKKYLELSKAFGNSVKTQPKEYTLKDIERLVTTARKAAGIPMPNNSPVDSHGQETASVGQPIGREEQSSQLVSPEISAQAPVAAENSRTLADRELQANSRSIAGGTLPAEQEPSSSDGGTLPAEQKRSSSSPQLYCEPPVGLVRDRATPRSRDNYEPILTDLFARVQKQELSKSVGYAEGPSNNLWAFRKESSQNSPPRPVNDEEFTNPWASSPVYDDQEDYEEWSKSGQQNSFSFDKNEEDEFTNPFAEPTYQSRQNSPVPRQNSFRR